MKNTLAHKLLMLWGPWVPIAAYIYGCIRLAMWSTHHLWIQRDAYGICRGMAPTHFGNTPITCVGQWYSSNVYWGTIAVIVFEIIFTVITLFLTVEYS